MIKSIQRHDRSQFEIKLDYPLDPLEGAQHYEVEAYFFFPANLGVDQHSYTSAQFYRDVQDHLRFRTPRMRLQELLDPQNERSPLTRLATLAATLEEGDREHHHGERVAYEARMLVNIVRAVAFDGEKHGVGAPLQATLERTQRVVDTFRGLEAALGSNARDRDLPGQLRLVDENLSLIVERWALNLGEAQPNAEDARALALREVAYRKRRGYLSLVDPEGTNELYAYRRSVLKKYTSAVLFLDRTQKTATNTAETIAFGIAAAAAMAFATAVTFVAATLAPLSWTLFMVLVVSYVAKDRIKEWFKAVFRRFADRRMDDHVVRIIDPASRETIGKFRQKARFMRPTELPAEVREVRAVGRTEFLAEREFAEHILRYRKRISLTPRRVFGVHRRVDALTDILRFDVTRFLGKMDDPEEPVHYPDPATGERREARALRTYHLNVVLRYRSDRQRITAYRKVRVIMTSEGIRRVDEVPLDRAPGMDERS